MSDRIAVFGGGAWGTALACMLGQNCAEVVLWMRDSDRIDEINRHRTSHTYLPGVELPQTIVATDDLVRACDHPLLLCVVPAQAFSKLLNLLQPHLTAGQQLVLCSKGIDRVTGRFMHQLAADMVPKDRLAVLSGPSFAVDVARGLPTAVSCAAESLEVAQTVASQIASPTFRIYATDDIVGVEVGGALKNVLALAVGIARGLQLGASAEAALIARGFAELTRIARALGARPETLSGLSGLGDLVLTCSSSKSRNFSYGVALAGGADLTGQPLAEGVHTAEQALALARAHDVEAPIIEAVVAVLGKRQTAAEAVATLLARPLRDENAP